MDNKISEVHIGFDTSMYTALENMKLGKKCGLQQCGNDVDVDFDVDVDVDIDIDVDFVNIDVDIDVDVKVNINVNMYCKDGGWDIWTHVRFEHVLMLDSNLNRLRLRLRLSLRL